MCLEFLYEDESLEARYVAELEHEQEGLLLNTSPGVTHTGQRFSLLWEVLAKDGVLKCPEILLLLPPAATFCTDHTDHILSLL